MRVFVTGASGFIGSAVIRELITAGHEVLGLARSDQSAAAIQVAGGKAHRGSLHDPESLRAGVEATDATIHLAFIHDFSKFQESCEIDRRVVAALGSALGADKHLLVTSGTALLGGRLATEDQAIAPAGTHPRVASEEAVQTLRNAGSKVSIVRLPPSVHGDGDQGFIPMLIALAREKKMAAFVDKGMNSWAAVHRLDAAKLYRLILEKGVADTYHAVADEKIPMRQIAEVIAERLSVPISKLTPEKAVEYYGWMAHFAALDTPASSRLTRERLGWRPTESSLLEDLKGDAYFPRTL